jgi:hypothetical protein
MTRKHHFVLFLAAFLLLLGTPGAFAGQAALSDFSATGSSLVWTPVADGEMTLRIATPDGRTMDYAVEGYSVLDVADLAADFGHLADGLYTWELRPNLALDQAQISAFADNTRGLVRSPFADANIQSGTFSLDNGVLISDRTEEASTGPRMAAPGGLDQATIATPGGLDEQSFPGQDVIVEGSLCVGVDCNTAGENFGFDTVILKENNLRVFFNDTSSSGSFPNVDWRLTANDSNNGGENKFTIDDATNGKSPFKIEANTPNNTIVADSNGRLGVGTASPVLQIHTLDGNTPGLRLEQDGSDGFAARTWDVAGNETNFFVRDVNDGSALPFRIYPGTGDDNLVLRNGRAGIGTANPSTGLHMQVADADGSVLIENNSSTDATRTLMALQNNGPVVLKFLNTNGVGVDWSFRTSNGGFFVRNETASQNQFALQSNGTLTISNDVGTSLMSLDSSGNLTVNSVTETGSPLIYRAPDAEIEALRAENQALADRLAALEARLAALEN